MWSAIGLATAGKLRVYGPRPVNNLARQVSRATFGRQQLPVWRCARPAISRRAFATASKASATKTAAKKTTKKTVARKKTKVAAKKRVVKKPARQPPSPEKLQKIAIKKRKEVALLRGEPALLPATKWLVFASEQSKKGTGSLGLAQMVRQIADAYKTLSASELEALERTAQQNKLTNQAAYKSWVESHSPAVIKEANIARRYLWRVAKVSAAKNVIKDDRLPKRPVSAFALFLKAKFKADTESKTAVEGMRSFSEEWKLMSDAERQPFIDAGSQDKARYASEVKSTLGDGK